MSKHTPGPWKYGTHLTGSENHRGFYLANDKGWTLAVVQPLDTAGIEGEANARLIAAAPDMDQLLRDIAAIAHYGGLSGLSAIGATVLIRKLTLPYFDTSMKEETARAAVARAEGEE